jgi:ribose 5-phosphate isomerase A
MTAVHLARLGEPRLREKNGSVVRTDAGNVIYDVRIPPMVAPAEIDRALRAIPGVVETGLFVGRCDLLIVAEVTGIRRVRRPGVSATFSSRP